MWPLGYGDAYPIDAAWMRGYAQMARTAEGFEALVAQWLAGRIVLDDGLKPLVGAGLEVMA
jgi:hypothetical protein